MPTSLEVVANARRLGLAIPAFNVAHLPMTEPMIRATADADTFALIEVSRIDWMKFGAQSLDAVAEEYRQHARPDHVRLHLDHVPVIDEDDLEVDYLDIIGRAIHAGYDSVMVDGSRLDLAGNIDATRRAADIAHQAGIACEAELGAVLGHSNEELPPYEELFISGKGFTDVEEARCFVAETKCDWLSVAVGNVHGAVSKARRDTKKVAARLHIEHLARLHAATDVPLVLHGGSGIPKGYVQQGIQRGIAKVNVGTELRQVYEAGLGANNDVAAAQEACYERTKEFITDAFGIAGKRAALCGEDG